MEIQVMKYAVWLEKSCTNSATSICSSSIQLYRKPREGHGWVCKLWNETSQECIFITMITLLVSYKHTSNQHHKKNQFISVLFDNELPPC